MLSNLVIPLERRTLGTQVADILREAIIQGRIEGEINESRLAQELEVGRSTLREALHVLGTEGLISKEPHKSWTVMQISERTAWEVASVRASLEGMAAFLAAQQLTPENRSRLTAAVEAMENAVANDPDSLNAVDLQFHRTLVELSGNSILFECWTHIAGQAWLMIMRNPTDRRSPAARVLAHRELLESVLSGDPVRAQNFVRDQIFDTHRRPTFAQRAAPWPRG